MIADHSAGPGGVANRRLPAGWWVLALCLLAAGCQETEPDDDTPADDDTADDDDDTADDDAADDDTADDGAPVAILVADPEPALGVSPLMVSLDASGSFDPGGEITEFRWDLDGDGVTDETGATIQHEFDTGEVTATLTVVDADGNTDSQSLPVRAHPFGLSVYESNPRYFSYKGQPVYLVAVGVNDPPNIGNDLFDELQAAGVNQYQKPLLPNIDNNSGKGPYVATNTPGGHDVDNNWGGWDEAYFQDLAEDADAYEAEDTMMGVMIFSSPHRRHSWGTHVYNIANGGPVQGPGGTELDKAVDEFYTFDQFTTDHANPHNLFPVNGDPDVTSGGGDGYDDSWGWPAKNQYRQEQLMAKLMATLPEDEHPNVFFVLNWEIFSAWWAAEPWAFHMVDFIERLPDYETRPVGIGRSEPEYALDVEAHFSFQEAHNAYLNDFQPSTEIPLVYYGFHPRTMCYYEYTQNSETCECFQELGEPEPECGVPNEEPDCCWPGEDDEDCNARTAEAAIHDFVTRGINGSMPFSSYWKTLRNAVKDDCDGVQSDYDPDVVADVLIPPVGDLMHQVRRVQTWADEPGGDEIPPEFPDNLDAITVHWPEAGRNYLRGGTMPVEWTTGPEINGDLTVNLLQQDGTLVTTITTELPHAPGSRTWDIPADLEPGVYFLRLKLPGVDNGRSADFTIW